MELEVEGANVEIHGVMYYGYVIAIIDGLECLVRDDQYLQHGLKFSRLPVTDELIMKSSIYIKPEGYGVGYYATPLKGVDILKLISHLSSVSLDTEFKITLCSRILLKVINNVILGTPRSIDEFYVDLDSEVVNEGTLTIPNDLFHIPE